MDVHSQWCVGDRAARAHGWICSVVSHGVVLTALVMSVEPVQVQETFQWDVEIVSKGSPVSQPVQASGPSSESPANEETSETSRKETAFRRAITPTSERIDKKPFTERVVDVSAARSDPSIQKHSPSSAIEPKELELESSAIRETAVTLKESQHIEVLAKASEAAMPSSASVLSEQSTSDPPISAPQADTRVIDFNGKQASSDSAQESETAVSSPHDATLNQRVMASNSPAMGESKRPDYVWLATAIRSRIEELKKYSEQARSNGWEGRVVVATTVQADGRLMDIRVVESSGNGRLDEDARQILHDASPMVLSQPLQAAQVIVKVPILFGLH